MFDSKFYFVMILLTFAAMAATVAIQAFDLMGYGFFQ